MDRSTPIKLIAQVYGTDALLQPVATETARTVYAAVRSTSRREWEAAGQQGLNPEYEITLFGPDYQGEEIVELNSQRFSVYRTYIGANETLTLYVERKAGTRWASNQTSSAQQSPTL